jgi:hypothetical protein
MRKQPCADEVRALRRERVSAAKLKRLGFVRQIYEAELRSGWGSYQGAIAAAYAGVVGRLVDCLCGRKALTDGDRDRLAAYIATRVRRRRWPPKLLRALTRGPTASDFSRLADVVEASGRRPGGMLDEPAHRAAQLAKVIMSLWPGRAGAEKAAAERAGDTVASGMAKIGIALPEKTLAHRSGTFRGIVGTYQRHTFVPEMTVALQRWADHVAHVVGGRPADVVTLGARR